MVKKSKKSWEFLSRKAPRLILKHPYKLCLI